MEMEEAPLEHDPGGSSEAEKLKKAEEGAASACYFSTSSSSVPPSFQFQSSLPNPDYGVRKEVIKNLEEVASSCQRLMDLMPTAAEVLVSIMQSANRAMEALKSPRGRFPAADVVSAGPAMKEDKMDAVKMEELHGSPPHPLPHSPSDNPHLVRAELPLPQSIAELAEQPQAGAGSSGGGVQGPPRQLIHARRGHATDDHSIAEHLHRERITKRKTLQELVPDANKVVLKLDLHDNEKKQKAMEVASTLHGIDSIAVDMKVEEMTVIGSVDPADVLSKLRELFPLAEIISPMPENTTKLPEISLEAPVCALVDVMYKLPAKLDGLLRHSHMLPKGAEDEIPLIKQDLEVMVAVLHDYSNSGAENCAMMIKCLMKEVHELSYDIEDCIDQYENAVDSRSGPVFRIPRRLITRRKSKTSRVPKKLKQRLWMANKIREFSMRSQEALQRYILFNPDAIGTTSPSSSSTDSRKKICTASTRYDASFGPWHPTPYGESPVHPVGIDAPVSKLKVWLAKDGEQNVKVISIVGFGGIGKTTLAKELYHTIGGQFECRAFVRTSQKPDIKRLLISILSQVRPHRSQHTWKVHNLISDIRTHLQDKRYLIIIDDVWSTSTWDIVSRALPESNNCSRIIITSEIEDVALRCCAYDPKYVFMMKPLSNDDSRILFFNTAFGCQHKCSPNVLEVSSNIIKKCGGLPLALVTIASVLASRMGKLGQWDYVNKSLGYGLRTNPTSDGMKQVLNLSYDNLPWHLKACLLYLSMYQEDWIIWKDDLVKQWIAEGFICASEDEDKEEIARRYFDELISSRMIQPAHINYNDEILSCTVHHMVLNLITHKSVEENFIIAIDHSQTTARLADKVRRLSLHFGNSEDATPPTNMRLSHIRTLAFFGVFKSVPSIVEFQLLQVLVLELWGDEENMSFDLTRISELFRLRYFQITSNVTLELRTKMQGLQYLETLKIDARLSVVPSDFCLPGLLHLNLPAGTKLPAGIARMTSLQTLGYVDLNINTIENVDSLGKLTNLQDLQLTYMAVPSSYLVGNMEFLGSILGKLSNLKSLTLVSAGSSHLCTTNAPYNPLGMICSGDGWSSMPCPPALLRRLELPHICIFSSLPRWIGGLAKLCVLKIAVRELSKNDVDVLKKLPVLTVLSLYVVTVPTERIAFDRTGFLLLRYFEFRCAVPWLKFEANAMPNLWKLKLGFSAHGYGAMPVGIEYLSVLKEVSAKISCVGPEESDRMTAESTLRNALRMHPGDLRVQVQHVHDMFDGEDDKSSVTKEDHMAFKQCDILEKDTSEQHAVLQKNSGEDVNKQADSWGLLSPDKGTSSTDVLGSLVGGEATGYKAKAPVLPYHNPSEEPPSPFNHRPGDGEWMATVQQPTPLGPSHSSMLVMDDGHRWRTYGQKQVMGTQKHASYYKCAFRGCPARKELSRSPDSQMTDVVYTGTHNHDAPQNTVMRSSRVLQSSHEASKRPVSGGDDTFEGPPSPGAGEQARSFQAISRRRLAENIEVPVNSSVSFSDGEVFDDEEDDGEVHRANLDRLE